MVADMEVHMVEAWRWTRWPTMPTKKMADIKLNIKLTRRKTRWPTRCPTCWEFFATCIFYTYAKTKKFDQIASSAPLPVNPSVALFWRFLFLLSHSTWRSLMWSVEMTSLSYSEYFKGCEQLWHEIVNLKHAVQGTARINSVYFPASWELSGQPKDFLSSSSTSSSPQLTRPQKYEFTLFCQVYPCFVHKT